MAKKKSKTGTRASRLKIDGDWKDAIGAALKKKRPANGWPEPEKPKRKTRKKKA